MDIVAAVKELQGQAVCEEIKRSLASYQCHLKDGHTYKLRKHVISNIKFKQKTNNNEEMGNSL